MIGLLNTWYTFAIYGESGQLGRNDRRQGVCSQPAIMTGCPSHIPEISSFPTVYDRCFLVEG